MPLVENAPSLKGCCFVKEVFARAYFGKRELQLGKTIAAESSMGTVWFFILRRMWKIRGYLIKNRWNGKKHNIEKIGLHNQLGFDFFSCFFEVVSRSFSLVGCSRGGFDRFLIHWNRK